MRENKRRKEIVSENGVIFGRKEGRRIERVRERHEGIELKYLHSNPDV